MKIEAHSHSSYPRFGKGDVAAIIAQQEAAGCDVVTDGLAPWADPFAMVLERVAGLRAGESVAYFDTAVRVPRPLVESELRRTRPLAVEEFEAARRHATRPVKVVLPGPYSLARLASGVGPYGSRDGVAHAFAELLAAEVADLAAAGAAYVQFDEPAILSHAADIRLLRNLFEPLWAVRGRAQVVLAVWGASEEPLYAQLNSVPADILQLDLVANPDLEPLIRDTGASKVLGLGLMDGHEDPPPSVEDLAGRVERMLRHYELDTLVLAPARGLRFETAARAFDTLQRVAAVASLLRRSL